MEEGFKLPSRPLRSRQVSGAAQHSASCFEPPAGPGASVRRSRLGWWPAGYGRCGLPARGRTYSPTAGSAQTPSTVQSGVSID